VAIALVSSVLLPTGTTGANSTGSPIDTTGATGLIAVLSGFQPVNPPTVSDSKGNTWTARTLQATGALHEARTQIFDCVAAPTVGTNHTFEWAYAGYGRFFMAVMAFSDIKASGAFDQENGFATNSEVSTIQPGSITPAEDNCLVICGGGFPDDMNSGTGAINGGFTIAHQRAFTSAGSHVGGLAAYLIQTSAAAANPTITAPTGTDPMSAVIASYKSTGGGGGGGGSLLRPPMVRFQPVVAQ
jgi:hypothetical protein